MGRDVGRSCHDGDGRLFESSGRPARDERRPWVSLAGCTAVRGMITWQHLAFWDALRFAPVVGIVFPRAAGTSCGPYGQVCGARQAACARGKQNGASTKVPGEPGRLGRLQCAVCALKRLLIAQEQPEQRAPCGA
jgi:hypothetical protein